MMKASGVEMRVDVIKADGEAVIVILHKILSLIWENKPTHINRSALIINHIHKKEHNLNYLRKIYSISKNNFEKIG